MTAALAGALLLGGAASAATLRVPLDHPTVTAALAAAQPGDRVLVAPGTYTTPAETFPLVIDADVELASEHYWGAVLDAAGSDAVIEMDAAGGGGRVTGFRITGGRAQSPGHGGGIRVRSGAPEIDGNLIHDNEAAIASSGVSLWNGSAAWVHHNVITRNRTIDPATGDAHGVEVLGAAGVIEHNVISHHDSNGLLIDAAALAGVVVRHNVFLANGSVAFDRGRGVCNFSPLAVELSHNLFHANVKAAVFWPGMGSDQTGAEANDQDPADDVFGNLDGDPLLASPTGIAPQDFALLAGSAAIDTGDPLAPADPDGSVADIGPYYSNLFGMPDADGDFVPDVDDNCIADPNLDQSDADADGVGDVCDAVCSDGIDNDGDGGIDFPADPGCSDALSTREDPQCQDGINNDPGQDPDPGLIDFDGGQSIHGACAGGTCPPGVSDPDGDGVADPDPQCVGMPWRYKEGTGSCGLGFELAFLLPGLMRLHQRRRHRKSG